MNWARVFIAWWHALDAEGRLAMLQEDERFYVRQLAATRYAIAAVESQYRVAAMKLAIAKLAGAQA